MKTVSYTHLIGKGDLTADLEKVKTEEEAKKIAAACEKKQAVVSSLKRETKTVSPPKLYDLTTLQREANRYYGFTAQPVSYTHLDVYKRQVNEPLPQTGFLCVSSDDGRCYPRSPIQSVGQTSQSAS